MKHVFKRKEEKFILPLQIAEDVKKLAVKKLGFSEFNKDGKLTDIRTTYFENDEFLIYHLKKSRKKKRYKIRIREYGRNGIFEPTIWIELKEKIDGVGYKSRFKIERKLLNDFLDGKTIFSHVVKMNNGINIDYLFALYSNIQNLIIENNLYPRLVMQYQRLAVQGEDSQGVRLTFDQNIKGGIINEGDKLFSAINNPKYFDRNKAIVELKIGGAYPKKADFLKRKFSIREQKFSKFLYGMELLFDDFSQIPDSVELEYTPMSEIANLDVKYAI